MITETQTTKTTFKTLGEYIRHHRKIAGLSGQALADRLGFSGSHINSLELDNVTFSHASILSQIEFALPTVQRRNLEILFAQSVCARIVERYGIDSLQFAGIIPCLKEVKDDQPK